MAERIIDVKMPPSAFSQIKKAPENEQKDAAVRVVNLLLSKGHIKARERVETRFAPDPSISPGSPVRKILVSEAIEDECNNFYKTGDPICEFEIEALEI
jgi:hypothetical protein